MDKVTAFEQYAINKPMTTATPDGITQFIQTPAGGHILDAGCGDGRFLEYCQQTMPDTLSWGSDISYVRLERCRQKNLPVLQADAERLPFPTHSFHTILFIQVIEHIWEPEPVIAELARLLQPGGRLILSTPNYPIKRLYDWVGYLRGNRESHRDDPTHFYPFSTNSIRKMCQRHFDSVEVHMTRIAGQSRLPGFAALHKIKAGEWLGTKQLSSALMKADNFPEQSIVLHIGYHKTGSTFLQKNIFPYLPANPVMMPNVRYLALSEPYKPDVFWQQLSNQYDLTGYNKTIISQETLSGRADGNPYWDTNRIAERLHQTFPQAKILLILREQYDYLLSLYAFRVLVRGLERRPLEAYLTKYGEWLKEKLQYHQLISQYQHLFGAENVSVLPHEQLVTQPEQFVQQILLFLGLQLEKKVSYQRMNPSTRNLALLQASRLINYPLSLFVESGLESGWLSEDKQSWIQNSYFGLKRKWINPVLRKFFAEHPKRLETPLLWQNSFLPIFSQSNQTTSKLTGLNLAQFGYTVA